MIKLKNLRLRQATAEDSEFAYQTKKAAFGEYVEQVWGWDEVKQRQIHERRFISQDIRVIQVSSIDCGIMATSREPDCIKLNQLFILPEYQSKGIGTACLKQLIEEADTVNLPVRLRVAKVNSRAFSFYQRQGFSCHGEIDTHFLMERLPLEQ